MKVLVRCARGVQVAYFTLHHTGCTLVSPSTWAKRVPREAGRRISIGDGERWTFALWAMVSWVLLHYARITCSFEACLSRPLCGPTLQLRLETALLNSTNVGYGQVLQGVPVLGHIAKPQGCSPTVRTERIAQVYPLAVLAHR